MSETIEELLTSLEIKYDDARKQSAHYAKAADLLLAEIRGIRSALNLLQPVTGNGAESPKQRRPRRDVRGLVRAYCDKMGGYPGTESAIEAASAEIGIKPSEMRKALAKDRRLPPMEYKP